MKLTIEITDNMRSLAAVESIDKDLMLSAVTKYLSEVGQNEENIALLSSLYLGRLDRVFADIINSFGSLTSEKLVSMVRAFNCLDLNSISQKLIEMKNRLKALPAFITKESIALTSTKYLDFYFKNKGFDFTEEAKTYLSDLVLRSPHLLSESKICSEIYWIYNEIRDGDQVRKVTKKGTTLGVAKNVEGKWLVQTEAGDFPLTTVWNKLTTKLDFSEIASDIHKLCSRQHAIFGLLKRGPIKAEFLKTKLKFSNGTEATLPTLLIQEPIQDINVWQIAFSGVENYGITNHHISFYNLLISIDFTPFFSESEMLDCFIKYNILMNISKIDGA